MVTIKNLTTKENIAPVSLHRAYKEREILIAYYIDGRTAEDIGNNLYFRLFNQTRSNRHIQRIIENATNKMLNL